MNTPCQKKILIIDDDARNIFALNAVLKAKGYSCISAGSAREALSLLSVNQDTGVILLDMMMPEMDGYETISKIRISDKSHLPIISITAQAMAGDKEKCLDAGSDGYLSKPIDVDELIILLQRYLK